MSFAKLKDVTFSVLFISTLFVFCNAQLPAVITTWRFTAAAEEAWKTIQNSSALDAVEKGCSVCEVDQCDGTVGYGGSPDENGETTLDAMIMDGTDMDVGAVGGLRRIKSVISVARHVLEHTTHSMLVGDAATDFAKAMGFKEESLTTENSTKIWKSWKDAKCQPNSWINVKPDPKISCGPYKPDKKNKLMPDVDIGEYNHDTIGMVSIDKSGNIAAGTSTNGLRHKIPGRVGDSPIPGSGAYADSSVGGAAATGDGDIMLRFLPSFLAVEEMRRGKSPTEAAKTSVLRMAKFYPKFSGGVIAINKDGQYGAGCHGMDEFPFTIANSISNKVEVEYIKCGEPNTIQL